MVTPRTLSGFKDRLPKEAYAKSKMLQSIVQSFEKFGFAPIETPHLEYAEILKKQGSDEIQKEMYHFLDHGEREVALRFDLTVPLARFIAQYKNEVGIPFKRYCIGNVFRGERAQKGRYREFTQCDFDFIGTDSIGADVEILQVIYQSLFDLGLRDFTIHINNRKIFNGLMESLNASNHTIEVLRIIDKIEKIGKESVKQELQNKTPLNLDSIAMLLDFIAKIQKGSALELLKELEAFRELNHTLKSGIDELSTLCKILDPLIPAKFYKINLSIARGLGYYTGIVYETTLNALPSLGSVCSGGRYDNLTQNFSKDSLSGVGASIGLDRLLSGLEELNLIQSDKNVADTLLIPLHSLEYGYKVAQSLRDKGLKIEVFPEITKPKKSFNYANNKGYKFVVITGEEEEQQNTCTLKNMESGEQFNHLQLEAVINAIKS
ncbi:histidine--tRNA ligase [Helicobacter winghamensis]|uniref:Histidine--tRNA ligase n=1 Tax=Helicobacter winghamensis TaxID=157268 RepID=A0A2N3PJ93_9HELI|nr:histidine--tRNA ligase [Helicobacter winghamensis]EEO25400.1 histidine--tRNA ligase [Helicobacter winghamensis ATCC BAA-430]PKT78237.1 histidine--tRNA ligase [Helicobacter winghamensis]PKT78434.1 histidine--tRNA ligase [Helicobacter winghamensis]PKT78766.1 histidine--tRNA ligase [Helicobacter winghamensis]PKT80465.1 histidine--tRNA ligase [Helicobacter winghamensis]